MSAAIRLIDKTQIRMIHTLTGALGMPDVDYRDNLTALFGVTSSKQLTYRQAQQLIDMLKSKGTKAGVWDNRRNRATKERAHPDRVRRFRFHAIYCGIRYAELGTYIMEDGSTLSGDELRQWLAIRFEDAQGGPVNARSAVRIPSNILRDVSTSWINPTANKWLTEGGFRKPATRPDRLYYHDMAPKECQYLIDRFRAMQEQLEKQDNGMDIPFDTNINRSTEVN